MIEVFSVLDVVVGLSLIQMVNCVDVIHVHTQSKKMSNRCYICNTKLVDNGHRCDMTVTQSSYGRMIPSRTRHHILYKCTACLIKTSTPYKCTGI